MMNRIVKTGSAAKVVNFVSAGRRLDINPVIAIPPPKLTTVMTYNFKGGVMGAKRKRVKV